MNKTKDLTQNINVMKNTKKTEKSFKEKLESGFININTGFDISELNEKEIKYFRMMLPKSGVLFLTSAPGLAKSAIMRSIAKKIKKVEIVRKPNGEIDVDKSGKVVASSMFYIDLRLAMLDETDVGLFPDKKEMKITENGEEVLKAFLDHIVPKWAYLSNNPPAKKDKTDKLPYAGTIIHFEELNRAPLAVRNAALQILLERCIGFEFEFNDNVFMVSTGNLGEEDGTDVEEFDAALNGRLIHIEHTLTLEEWINYYANEHINNIIVRFLTAHPDMYYIGKKSHDEKDKSYASPRTWTFLSDYITENYGFNANPQLWINDIPNIGHGYIGAACNTKFMRYVRDVLKISIKDIINRYAQLQAEGVQFTRDKKSELLGDLRTQDFSKFKPEQIENVKLFMLDLSEDEISAFLIKLIDEDYDYEEDETLDEKKNNFILTFLRDKRFKKYNQVMLNYVKTNNDDKDNNEW
ncbi:MAG: hypothetical protein HPY57_14520 [Ignavibacteria bacterium]|nr:hypothetical protein [Ignavibacteria bacterium]